MAGIIAAVTDDYQRLLIRSDVPELLGSVDHGIVERRGADGSKSGDRCAEFESVAGEGAGRECGATGPLVEGGQEQFVARASRARKPLERVSDGGQLEPHARAAVHHQAYRDCSLTAGKSRDRLELSL